MNWISVKDRLPPLEFEPESSPDYFSKTVLVTNGTYLGAARYDHEENNWISNSIYYKKNEITHWCEITLPPNEDHARIEKQLLQKIHRLKPGDTLTLTEDEEFAWVFVIRTIITDYKLLEYSYTFDKDTFTITVEKNENG